MPKPKPKPLGAKIKKMRQEKGFSLEDLANETGRSVAYLEEVEANGEIPPVAVLLQLSRAMKLGTDEFLKPDETAAQRQEAEAKRTAHYSYQALSPAKSDRHLKPFAISIPAGDEHTGVGYRHEGEEFVYVLSGQVVLTVGENSRQLAEGECHHFNSAVPHHMANPGEAETKLLVILYVP